MKYAMLNVNKKIKMELKGTVVGDTDTISTYFTAVLNRINT